MSVLGQEYSRATGAAKADGSPKPISSKAVIPLSPRRYRTPRDCPRVTLRLSVEDYERLKEQADGAALSVYLRALILNKTLPRRKLRSTASVADKQAIAQLLGMLGQSRIANNLNQLAYHANIGSLDMDDDAAAQLDEAYEHIAFMRQNLIKALGLKE